MKLGPGRQSLQVNESVTLSGIPPETFDYRLGSRSALEWVIDRCQVKGESDPNVPTTPATSSASSPKSSASASKPSAS